MTKEAIIYFELFEPVSEILILPPKDFYFPLVQYFHSDSDDLILLRVTDIDDILFHTLKVKGFQNDSIGKESLRTVVAVCDLENPPFCSWSAGSWTGGAKEDSESFSVAASHPSSEDSWLGVSVEESRTPACTGSD